MKVACWACSVACRLLADDGPSLAQGVVSAQAWAQDLSVLAVEAPKPGASQVAAPQILQGNNRIQHIYT